MLWLQLEKCLGLKISNNTKGGHDETHSGIHKRAQRFNGIIL